jgi:hypothetical protein
MELHLVSDAAELIAASGLFDQPGRVVDRAERFGASPGHRVVVAYEEGEPAGFVGGSRRPACGR